MINIANPIPSAIMLESYNSKIKKLLKYGNKDSITWEIVAGDMAGPSDVVFTLPGGVTKTTSIIRTEISKELPADEDGYVKVDTDNINLNPELENIQNDIIAASNISKSDFATIYSEEFAMSVLIWVSKGIYIPPQDMILTDLEVPEPNGLIDLDDGLIGSDDIVEAVARIVKLTKVTIKSTSLAYVGEITVANTTVAGVSAPAETVEYDLSQITNCGIPGQWNYSYNFTGMYSEQHAVNSITNTIFDIIATQNDFHFEWNTTSNEKDYDFLEPGKVSYIIKPAREGGTYRFLNELRLVITQDSEVKEQITNITHRQIDNTARGPNGRRGITVSNALSDQDIIDQISASLAQPVFNDTRYPQPTNSWFIPPLDLASMVDITINGTEFWVQPKPEFEYKELVGLLIFTVTRTNTPIEPYTVTSVLGKDSTDIVYDINPTYSSEDAAYAAILSIVKQVMFISNRNVTVKDLVSTVNDNVITIVPTPEADGVLVNCNVVITLNPLVPREPLLVLNDLGVNGVVTIPQPDFDAEGYSFRAVVEEILLEATISAGSDEVIDLDSMEVTFGESWNGGNMIILNPKLDTQLIGSLNIKYSDIRPAVMHTDLSTISNIGKPGKMMLPKSREPGEYPSTELLTYAMSQVTSGTINVNKAIVHGTYENKVLTIVPGYGGQPGTTVGRAEAIFVNYNTEGQWVTTLNLSEITNADTPGIWNYNVPHVVDETNYIFVVNAIKEKLKQLYSVATAGLVGTFSNGVITISPDPDALVDADGTLTVNPVLTDYGAVPARSYQMTVETGEGTGEALEMYLSCTKITGAWSLWINGEIVANSDGLTYSDDLIITKDYNGLTFRFLPELFSGETVTINFDVDKAEHIKVSDGDPWTDIVRTTVVDQFSTTVSSQTFEIKSLTAVPTVLPEVITNADSMFHKCKVFNQDLATWDVSRITTMNSMFADCRAFNQDISGWDVSNVTSMWMMFSGAYVFNQPIGAWNVGRVVNMDYMFQYASAFNQDLSGWDVSRVPSEPYSFALGTDSTWTEPKPVWNTIDSRDNGGR